MLFSIVMALLKLTEFSSQTDLGVEKMNGDVHVIAMSGLVEDKVHDATAAGAGYVLQNPFSAETLLRTLSQVLDGQNASAVKQAA